VAVELFAEIAQGYEEDIAKSQLLVQSALCSGVDAITVMQIVFATKNSADTGCSISIEDMEAYLS